MNSKLDLPRLSHAIDEAVAAVPVAGCQGHSDVQVRRACQEMALYLIHLRELSVRLGALIAESTEKAASSERG
jgi:hypothetical protein